MLDTGLQYTLTTPAGAITLNPDNYEPPGYYLRDIDFSAPIASETSERPQTSGSYLDPGYRSGLTGIMEVDVIPTSVANRESLKNALYAALLSLLGDEGTATLSWTPADGSAARQLSGLQIIEGPTQIRRGGTLKGYHVALKAQKPYAEDVATTTVDTVALTATGSGWTIPLVIPVSIVPSGGGTATLTNSGSHWVKPIMRIIGPITSPTVANLTTGERLVFTGSISSGDYWEIDLFEQTVKLNGLTTVTTLELAASTWFYIGRGDTDVQLTGSGFTASTLLRTFMRSGWGG